MAAFKPSRISILLLALSLLPQAAQGLSKTTLTIAAAPNPSTLGVPVTLTATVTPSNATGHVTFYDGVTILGTKPLSGGAASFLTGLLPSGPHKLHAYYGGDSSNAAATSNVIAQAVNAHISTGSFLFQGRNIPAYNGPVVGDFDGDGKADIAYSRLTVGGIVVELGQGDGTFQSKFLNSSLVTDVPVAVGDFNGDGKADLVVVDTNTGSVSLMLGNGDGTLQTPVSIVVVPKAFSVAVGDFNGDGKADLAIANSTAGVSILLGNGDGTFQNGFTYPTSAQSGLGAKTVAVGDFNGDGKADLVTTDGSTPTVGILFGNGDGSFQGPAAVAVNGLPTSLAIGDFNQDGNTDIAVAQSSSLVSILLNPGDGTFPSPFVYATIPGALSVAVGDFNGDGIPDLALGNQSSLSILLGNGNGSFQSPANTAIVAPSVVTVELNGDGKTDLIASGSVLLGTTMTLTATGGTPQSTLVGMAFPVQLQATLRDGANPVSGATVTFTPPAAGGQSPSAVLSSPTAVTDASGVARVTATANQYPGSYTVTASSQGLLLSPSFSLTNTAATPMTLTVVSGTPQSAALGTAFPNALKVKLTDSIGNPVSGASVNFAVPASGATAVLSSGSALTDSSGVAMVTATAGSVAGSYMVTASFGSLPAVTFSLTNVIQSTSPVTLTASPNPSTLGAPVTLTATVTPSSATGRVTFYDGITVLGTKALSGGSASFLAGPLPSGPRKLRAYYAGDPSNAAATSNVVTQTVNAQPSNALATGTPISQFTQVVVGDFTGDGIVDLATANAAGSISIWKGTGASFQLVATNPPTVGFPVAVADFNVDGKTDLLVQSEDSAANLYLLAGNGDGTFQAAVKIASAVSSPVVGDFNGDGKPDIAFAVPTGVNVLVGNGDGTFQAPALYPSNSGSTLAVGDFNGDGITDIVAGNGSTVSILLGNADGTFQAPLPDSALTKPTYILVADLNGDGKLDLVTVSNPNQVSIQLGNGNGTFGAPVVTYTAQAATRAAVGDFNGDGNADIAIFGAISASTGNNVSILLGNGDGTFRAPINYPASSPMSVLVAGDFNGDGKTDLLTGGSLLLGTTLSFTATGGTPQSAQLSAAFTNPLQVTLTDSGGNPVSGVTVTFAAPPTGASATLSSPTAVTNASGIASVTATANSIVGSYTISANAGLMLSASFSLTNTSGQVAIVSATGGTPQSATLGTAFAAALQVAVKDSLGNPLNGITVSFLAPSTGASANLSSPTAVTNASGIASVAATANSTAGAYTVTASVGALSASFSLTNTSGQAAIVSATSGTPQSATLGTAFANALQATVRDSLGNPLNGITVSFLAPSSGASANLSSPTAVTNASGIASVAATANSTAGAYTVTASVGALSASFSLNNTSGQPASVTATGGMSQSAPLGTAFATALQAIVKDSLGNPVSGVIVVFTTPSTGASATLSSPSVVTDASGIASVTATANNIAGGYFVTATVGTFSANFALTNTTSGGSSGLPASIAATGGTTQSAPSGTAFATALQTTVRDSAGNPVSGATVTYGVPLMGASAVLSGSSALTNASGVASVTATANSVMGSYTIIATVTAFVGPGGVFSTNFSLTNTLATFTSITATGGTPQSASPGAAFPNALQATVKDSLGNPVSGVTVTFAAPSTGAGAMLSSPTAVTNLLGIATVTATANNIAGSYTVTASVGSLGTFFSLTNLSGGSSSSNLAQGKTATQSSTFPGYASAVAGSAVDGNTDGNFGDGSVTATNLDPNAWWQVDLGASEAIGSVVIFNRTDCCGSRLSDYWVFISDTPFLSTDTPLTLQNRAGTFASHQTGAPTLSTTITAAAEGRYLRVQLTGTNYLSLAEVQVFGAGGAPSPTNLAQGRLATQSSTFPGFATDSASAAVDGNIDGNFGDGSVTATNADPNAWWQVDLGASATVNSVTVWNRTDCCASRLTDYWVFISNTPFLSTDTPLTLQNRAGTFASHQTAAPNPSTIVAANGAQGRYVRVQLTGTDYLSLAEVQVLGTGGASLPTDVAQGKVAAQSSIFPGYTTDSAAAAVDGNTDGNFGDGSVTATNLDPNPWWQVDLGASTAVSSVIVWNRTDCCTSRLNDYWVFISDTPFLATDTPTTLQNRAGTFASHQTAAPNPATIVAAVAQGRYVRVQLTNSNYLSLAEVQVFGQ